MKLIKVLSYMPNNVEYHLLESTKTFRKHHKCTFCEFKTIRTTDLQRHLLIHTAKSLCRNRTAFVSILKKPKKLHGSTYCWYSTHHPSNLRDHLKKHTEKEERLFQCSVYKKLQMQYDNLCSSSLAFGQRYHCTVCTYSTYRKDHLKVHLLRHAVVYCSFYVSFARNTFKVLQNTKVSSSSTAIFASSGRRREMHKCNHCSYSSFKRCKLKDHLRTHTGEKPFVCHFCSKELVTSSTFFEVLPSGKQIKVHKCDCCNYSTLKKSHLEYHLLTHTGEKPFSCGICFKAFATKGNLKQHTFIHLREGVPSGLH
ncbi:histone-lysine N-methyltransferase PRDM9 [Trichonephila clavata]|uniref:Histone-lysine N-methyltransferase PRDM9 n=1 Tax=Trichonephila clavata TaxID=2740835 RepID=A0A8X6LX48_TRICU|nr:histone-lysine N-methyltransferase PRDM9 [Trichonephila clavata]